MMTNNKSLILDLNLKLKENEIIIQDLKERLSINSDSDKKTIIPQNILIKEDEQVKKNDIKQKPRVNPKIRSINIDSSLIFANNLNNCKLSQQKPKERSVNRKTNAIQKHETLNKRPLSAMKSSKEKVKPKIFSIKGNKNING